MEKKNNIIKKLLALGLVSTIYATLASPKLKVKIIPPEPDEDPYNVEETYTGEEKSNKDGYKPEIDYTEESSEPTLSPTATPTIETPNPEETKAPTIYEAKFSCVMYDTNIVDENGNYLATAYQFEKVLKMDANYQNSYRLVMLDNGITGYIEANALRELTDTFVEVDISSQMLYVYSNGECVMTANVITGNPNTGSTPGTNIGLQEILYKAYNTKLVGPTWDVPVDYFFCFNYDGEGFHDASWRTESEYTADTYTWNGSHGCVNMKHSDVSNLDNLISTGDKVLIHK